MPRYLLIMEPPDSESAKKAKRTWTYPANYFPRKYYYKADAELVMKRANDSGGRNGRIVRVISRSYNGRES